MAYNKEKASKFAYQTIIKDPKVQQYLSRCFIPDFENITKADFLEYSIPLGDIKDQVPIEIKKAIVVDGGYQIVNVKEGFPSAEIAYYSVGLMSFDTSLLKGMQKQSTIDPNDVYALKNLYKHNFQLPVKTIKLLGRTFQDSIRETIFEIFYSRSLFEIENEQSGNMDDRADRDNSRLIDTLKWLIFEEYNNGQGSMEVSCPNCGDRISFSNKTNNYKDEVNNIFECCCGGEKVNTIVYITDCLELHTLVDDFNGATGIVSYVMSAFEVLLMFTIHRFAYEKNAIEKLSDYLFIKDGPLALFSRLDDLAFKKIRPFVQFLHKKSIETNKSLVNMVGLDKSGMFVEHLKNVENKLADNTVVLPNSLYIKKYISGETTTEFGEKTYYGIKMIFKKDSELSFVVDFPFPSFIKDGREMSYVEFLKMPDIDAFINIKSILELLIEMKCDIYESSFIPIALINKHVSVSHLPGSKMLKVFTRDEIAKTN